MVIYLPVIDLLLLVRMIAYLHVNKQNIDHVTIEEVADGFFFLIIYLIVAILQG